MQSLVLRLGSTELLQENSNALSNTHFKLHLHYSAEESNVSLPNVSHFN